MPCTFRTAPRLNLDWQLDRFAIVPKAGTIAIYSPAIIDEIGEFSRRTFLVEPFVHAHRLSLFQTVKSITSSHQT
jgi:hypothetical protein